MKHILLNLSLCFLITACASTGDKVESARALPKTIEEAVNSPYRTAANRPRDIYRHPVETLSAFGLKPEMTVVEITPGAGWYTEILAPFLAEKGQYIAAVGSGESDSQKKALAEFNGWISRFPEAGSKVKVGKFNLPDDTEFAPAGTVDVVLTFRNVHNWMDKKHEQAAFKAFFKALKPGGTLGVVEHRAKPTKKEDPKAVSGYVTEAQVLRFAKKAGFVLSAKSEVNANPKDDTNHPEGVWTLPPKLELGEKDKDKYLAIGESDRMTIRFVKPKK